jgi:hypothetical protein
LNLAELKLEGAHSKATRVFFVSACAPATRRWACLTILLGVWLFQHGPITVGEIVTFMVFASAVVCLRPPRQPAAA